MLHIVAPSTVNILQVTATATTALTITWTVSESVDRFEILYNYTVHGCLDTGGPLTVNIADGSMRSYTLRDLNEDSMQLHHHC